MKFRNSFAILAMSAAFLLAACGGGGQPQSSTSESSPVESSDIVTRYTVTFDVDGGSSVPAQTVEAGQKATRPSNPVKMGFDFDDWYRDPAKTMAFDFNTAINANITLYAKWIAAAQSSDSTPEGEEGVFYFREATWWNSGTGVALVSIDGAGVTGEDPAYELDFTALVPMTLVSTVRQSATDYFNYWSLDLSNYEEAETLQIFRCGPVYVDDKPTDEMSYWGAQTVVIDLSDAGENNMYDLLATDKPAAWQEGAPEGASRSVTGEWSIYDPSSDVPYVPGGDSGDTGEELDEITTKYGLRDVDTGKYLCALEMSAEKDHQGRDQASALGVSFKTGVKFQLYDTENSAGWVVPVEGWSLGGSSADDTKYLEYFSVGADYWEVIQDFTGDVYAKFKMNDDGIYFGLSA